MLYDKNVGESLGRQVTPEGFEMLWRLHVGRHIEILYLDGADQYIKLPGCDI